MQFIEGAPTFAVEVHSENDYGKTAEAMMARKRADYFEAGTKVVRDVDPQAEVINVYDEGHATKPRILRRGEVADADPAVPCWRFDLDRAFGR
jgi:Uma2 family endonuclease